MIKVLDYYAIAYFLIYTEASYEETETFLFNGDWDKILLLKDVKPYWRKKVYPEYKGHRKPNSNPELFKATLAMIDSFKIPSLSKLGLEADDWAGVIRHTKELLGNTEPLTFVTPDSDWLQLVDDTLDITWSKPSAYPMYLWDEKRVIKRTLEYEGNLIEHPRDIAKIKFFKGDTSDNIPAKLDLDLVSLQGKAWVNNLAASGIQIEELIQEVMKALDWAKEPHAF